jgi:signal transduction histidine kinase
MGGTVVAGGRTAARRVSTGRRRAVRGTLFSVRTHVVVLILVIVTPLLAFSAALVLRAALNEQDVMANTVRERTRAAAATLDHELGSLRSRMLMLAGSSLLQEGDVAAFTRAAADMAAAAGAGIVLTDLSGQELVNTLARPGDPLPASPDPAASRRIASTGEPEVSSLTRDPATGEMYIAIDVPVLHAGRLAHVLSLNLARLLPRMAADLNLPQEWLLVISDRDGHTLERSFESERFVGQMGSAAALRHFRAADEGWFTAVSRDGVPMSVAFAHVKVSGWTVAVGIPDAVLFAPVHHSTRLLILSGVAVLAIGLALALAIGHRISGAITGLVGRAELVGLGERIDLPETGVREIDAVARSLHQAGERLHQNALERSELLARTITAQEAERRRIARELHDGLGQYLSALRLGFSAIEPDCSANPAAHERLCRLTSLASDLGRELNRIAWELRPMALDDLGLRRAVTEYLEEWADRSHLRIDLEINLRDGRLPQEVETALFRVLQELIANVVKHAGAHRVDVVLETRDGEVRLIVEDDGKGLDLAPRSDKPAPGIRHLGLVGVRERLALVGGSLELESGLHGGMTAYVRIPL